MVDKSYAGKEDYEQGIQMKVASSVISEVKRAVLLLLLFLCMSHLSFSNSLVTLKIERFQEPLSSVYLTNTLVLYMIRGDGIS